MAMTLILDDAEVCALRQALESYLPELRYELARVKLERDRHELVQREERLTDLLQRLATPGWPG